MTMTHKFEKTIDTREELIEKLKVSPHINNITYPFVCMCDMDNEYTSEDAIKRMEKYDIPKYKKKTKSNTSKAKEKAKHKHEYKDCLFMNDGRAYMGTYCNICGKIYNWCLPVFTVEEDGHRRMMTNEEVLEKYKNLEKIEVHDLWAKYIPILK